MQSEKTQPNMESTFKYRKHNQIQKQSANNKKQTT